MPDKGKRFLENIETCSVTQACSLCPNVRISDPANDHLLPPSEGKSNPVQAWTGPEGSRRLRLPDFKTIGT
jgi:hypothetical protein